MTIQGRFRTDDQFTTHAFGKVPAMRKMVVFDFTGRGSSMTAGASESNTSARNTAISIAFFFVHSRGLGCHEVSCNFRKQRCIRENVKGRHGKSLALSHGTVVPAWRC
jgi:hypothetical protein